MPRIKLQTAVGSRTVEVEDELLRDGLACHLDYRAHVDGWNVTHVASGLMIGPPSLDEGDARQLLSDLLGTGMDWRVPASHLVDQPAAVRAREIVAALHARLELPADV